MHLMNAPELLGSVLPVAKLAPGRTSATGDPRDEIRVQAQEIIADVLAPGSGCEEKIRQGLRRHVAACPGRPDHALLEHVLTVRGTQYPAPSTAVQPPEVPSTDRRIRARHSPQCS
jgi:hypothetical protein